jgi:hypothetical protein
MRSILLKILPQYEIYGFEIIDNLLVEVPRTPEVVCTLHSQASYWFSIGFKQMVCTVATCYWFLALLWFYKT